MRKQIKAPVLCEKCGSTLKHGEDATFCDFCKKQYASKSENYTITVFWKDRESDCTTRQEFCSVNCAREWLINFPYNKKRIEFIVLPYMLNFSDIQKFLAWSK